jgi:hypothetical protein
MSGSSTDRFLVRVCGNGSAPATDRLLQTLARVCRFETVRDESSTP